MLQQLAAKIELMWACGLNDDEILRLARLRQQVEHGECTELTGEFKRLAFFQYLHATGRLHD
ncbi:MAG: hypothetical protein QOF51_914 [Chloroflexota bacterium]|jgi:hypothetical protein|nr:hypothetical protein [Chloroflexota bacterium]